MTDSQLKNDILGLLAERKAMAGGSIAWVLKTESKRVRYALYDLMDAGQVRTTRDGFQYELTGDAPGPEAA